MTTVPVTTQDRIPIPMHLPARPTQAASAMTPADVLRIVKQRIYLIVFFALLFIGLFVLIYSACMKGMVIPGVGWRLEKKYESFGVVSVDSPNPGNPMVFGGEPSIPLELMNRNIANQMYRLKQPDILNELLSDSEVQRTIWFSREPDSEKPNLLEVLKDDLAVIQAPDANAFVVSFKAPTASDAKTIVERAIAIFLRRVDADSKTNYMKQLTDIYQKQRDELKRQRDLAEQQKRALAGTQAGGVTGLAEGRNIDSEKLRGLLVESARAEADFALVSSQWESLRTTDPSQLEPTPAVLAVLDDDQEVINLKLEIRKTERALTNLQLKEKSDPKEAQVLGQQIRSLQKEMKELVADKMRKGLALQLDEAERAHRNASDVVLSLREKILEEQGKARDADTKLFQYQRLVEEQKRIDEQIAKVSDYMSQLQLLIDNDAERMRVSWLSRPIEAIRPTLDYRIRLLTAGTYGWLGVPVVFAILLAIVRTVRWASRLGCTVWVDSPQSGSKRV